MEKDLLLMGLAGVLLLALGTAGIFRRRGSFGAHPGTPAALVFAGSGVLFINLGGALLPTDQSVASVTPGRVTFAVDGQAFAARAQPVTPAEQAADIEAAAQERAAEAQREAEAAGAQREAEAAGEARPSDPRRTPEGDAAAAEQQWYQEMAAEAKRQHETAALVAEQER